MDNPIECKSTKSSTEEDQPINRLVNLPRDIILDILSRLPIRSLIQFKCVCQTCHTLVQDPRLPNLHLTRATENNPCLIIHRGSQNDPLYFVDEDVRDGYNRAVRKTYTPFMSVMPKYTVMGSCNGLLCLYASIFSDSLYRDLVYIYNPITETYIELPETIRRCDAYVFWGFGFHPRTKEYKVVRLVYKIVEHGFHHIKGVSIDVQIFTLGSDVWRSIGNTHYEMKGRISSQALVNGALHWKAYDPTSPPTYSALVVAFDIAEEKFLEVPNPDRSCMRFNNYHLMVLGGCLSAVVYSDYSLLEIWVMKEYNVKESWTKEFKLGSYVPTGLSRKVEQSFRRDWKYLMDHDLPRVLCLLKNGEILLQYGSEALVSYDPENKVFRDLIIRGLPNWFGTVTIHVGSLI